MIRDFAAQTHHDRPPEDIDDPPHGSDPADLPEDDPAGQDLAKKSGKEVDLAMSGEETEIDRNMVDALYEPWFT
jgi:hypothetical protein